MEIASAFFGKVGEIWLSPLLPREVARFCPLRETCRKLPKDYIFVLICLWEKKRDVKK
jgi:hypothetical protein